MVVDGSTPDEAATPSSVDPAPEIAALSATQRAWTWMRSNPAQTLGLLAGTLAFLRLVAVSHARLATARVLLDHADLASLSGGLVLSAAILWIPAATAWVVYMALAPITSPSASKWIGTIGALVTIGGPIVLWNELGLSIDSVPHGGPNFAVAAIVLGAAIGAVLHAALRDVSDPAADAERREQELRKAAVLEMFREQRPPPSKWSEGLEAALDYVSRAFTFALALALLLAVLYTVLIVLSEPSQPPENLTVREGTRVETRTVHVLDDSGDEWLVMRRGDRQVVSVAAADIVDRYLCAVTPLADEPTELVQRNVIDPMRGLEPPEDAIPDAVQQVASDADDDDADAAAWIDAITDTPPPCALEWSSDELELVRADLGVVCGPLSGCKSTDP